MCDQVNDWSSPTLVLRLPWGVSDTPGQTVGFVDSLEIKGFLYYSPAICCRGSTHVCQN